MKLLSALLLAPALLLVGAADEALLPTHGGPEQLELASLSNRADLISGGDVLLEVRLASGGVPAEVAVEVDGRDVTDEFEVRGDGRLIGLVDGLGLGESVVTATSPDAVGARLVVTNHPVGGPIFAGPQVEPWICTTADHGLGEPLDEQCNVEPRFDLYYFSSGQNGGFAEYDPDNPPSDVATTTTDEGVTVPYIVRRERGVLDRGIYDITVLHDPSQSWEPWAPQAAWNGKVHWPFGGSCQPYHAQIPPGGRPDTGDGGLGSTLDDNALSKGWAVAASGFGVLGSNCNTVVSAEALMMIKERIVENYGPIRYSMGSGNSGGSIQQIQIAGAYPGLLDGITPGSTFADIVTTAAENIDCRLLLHYFTVTSPHLWNPLTQAAVEGGGSPTTCVAWRNVYGFVAMLSDPTLGCMTPLLTYLETDFSGTSLRMSGEPHWVYGADNPDGTRCTIYDYMTPIFGVSDEDPTRANRPYDNVGVQYGLEALLSGLIVPEQFVDLNEKIGGLGHEYEFVPQRSQAELAGVINAYRSGQATQGRHLAKVPILDNSYAAPHGDIHTAFHAFSLHERIAASNGHADNHVIRQLPGGTNAFVLMDNWLAAMEADTEPGSLEEKVVRNKPADAQPSGDYFGTDPRIAAGGPLRADVLKCHLVPLDVAMYAGSPVPFTDDQLSRLAAVFPDGVCDWSQPSVGQQETIAWATYAAGDGPVALGPPPTSESLATGLPRLESVESGSPLPSTGGGWSLALVAVGLAAFLRRKVAA